MQEKTYSQMRNEFQENFFNLIKPSILDLEDERKHNLIVSMVLSILFILLAIVMFSSLALNSAKFENIKFIPEFMSFMGLIFVMLAFNTIPYTKKSFENSVKQNIMPLVCSCFENLEWAEGEYYDDRMFFNANLLLNYPRYSAKYDDIFKGMHKEVHFEIAELFWQKNENQLLKAREGAIVKIKMNKNFTGNTIIESKRPLTRGGIMGGISEDYSNLYNNGKLNLIKLEDIEFNKKYDIYTNDEVEARYLITPSFMQRLKYMKTAFRADKMRCSFYEGYLLIGLFTKKDLFSICSLFKPVDDPKQFFTMFEEILSIVKLIDYFKLNLKTGL